MGDGAMNGNGAVTGYGTARHAEPFPFWDRRRLLGEWTVRESADRMTNYRWAEQQFSAALGGWSATIPELDVKASLGRVCFEHAWHADLWRERLPELQERNDERCEPPNDDFVTFMNELTGPDDPDATIEKLVGIYRVMIPHMLAVYTFHRHVTSHIVDAPTVRLLNFMIHDDGVQYVEGEMLIQDLARTEELCARAGKWKNHLDWLLAKSGGMAGPKTLGGRPKIQMPGKAILGAALREQIEARAGSAHQ